MKFSAIICTLCVALAPMSASALDMQLPDVFVALADDTHENAAFSLPVAPFSQGVVQTRELQGNVQNASFSFPIAGRTTADIMDDLRRQVLADGFAPLLDCFQARCGGFDFRYLAELFAEPDMHVDLGDYRFLSAVKSRGTEPVEYVQLMVSRSPTNGYVQVTRIGEKHSGDLVAATKSTEPGTNADAQTGQSLAEYLIAHGYVVLEDLTFETGSSRLNATVFASLADLARFLAENPDISVALVGHSDAKGSLAPNLTLSRQRAQSVLRRLVDDHEIDPTRLEADGVGYLSPRASNLTEEGRSKNRRVEVVITSTR